MNLLEKVKTTIQKYDMLSHGDSIAIGISGGPDSVALLLLLNDLKAEYRLILLAAHVNYKLRGEESDKDEEFVENLCRILNIPLHKNICSLKDENGFSIQEKARNERYDFYEELCKKLGANKIAVGHILDDSVETILLNFIRGSGVKGLSGIPPIRDKIIRPLIECSRDEIIEFLSTHNQNYRIDSTNQENKYLRNKIRNILLPTMTEISSSHLSKKNIFQTGEILRDEDDYLQKVIDEILKKICIIKSFESGSIIQISIPKLDALHIALKRRLIRKAIIIVAGALYQFEKKHIDEILDLSQTTGKERRIHLPQALEAVKSYDNLILQKKNDALSGLTPPDPYNKNVGATGWSPSVTACRAPTKIPLKIPGITNLGEGKGSIKAEIININDISNIKTSPNEALLDYSKCGSLYIRYRQDGDTFTPFGLKGKKKLKDYFIDKKVPRYLRDSIPIVVSDDDIAWVVGFTIDEGFRIIRNTKVVLHLYLINYLS